jgi:hypothetical protein
MNPSRLGRPLARGMFLLTVVMPVLLLGVPPAGPRPSRASAYLVTNTHDSGPGSLRQAITAANNNPGPDTITFDPATDGTPIFLVGDQGDDTNVSGDLDILAGGLTIQGNGTGNTILDGSANDRVLHICPGGGCTNPDAVTLSGLTIRSGGGIEEGGGILNSGAPLTLEDSAIGVVGFGNAADLGGGISVRPGGHVTLDHCTVSANLGASAGGIYNAGTLYVQGGSLVGGPGAGNQALSDLGGGIYNASTGTVTVDGSTVSANTANHGAGIYNAGTLYVQNGSLVGGIGAANQAASYGGGIYNQSSSTATVDGSTISANTAGNAAGIFNEGTLYIQNGSLVGGAGAANQATYTGGGIYNWSAGTATVDGSTVSANTADNGAGIYNAGTLWFENGSTLGGFGAGNQATNYGGGIYNGGTTTVTGSRILRNTASNLGGGGVYNHADAVRATVTGSCLAGNSDISFVSDQVALQTATGNWWGSPAGPNTPGADTVSGNVDTSDYLTQPILGCACYVYLPLLPRGDE